MLDKETATYFGFSAGDEITLVPAVGEKEPLVRVKIAGIMEPENPKEEYWLDYRQKYSPIGRSWLTAHFFIPEATLFDALGATYPKMSVDYWWFLNIDQSRIKPENAGQVGEAVQRASRELQFRMRGARLITEVGKAAEDFTTKLFFLRVPLVMIVAMIEAMLLFYLWMVASALTQQQEEDTARLQSRGSSPWRVISLLLTQGLTLALLGFLLGPPLSLLIISTLGRLPPFHPLTSGAPLPAELSPQVYLFAGTAALVALVAVLLPGFIASTRNITEYKARLTRPPARSWLQRFYLDFVLMILGSVLLYLMASGRDFVSRELFGGLTIDAVMILTPTLLLLVSILIFLRLFPALVTLLGWGLERTPAFWVVMSLRHMRREPLGYSGLVALLILAGSLGMFASSFGKTLEHSYQERALYAVGSDVRIDNISVASFGKSFNFQKVMTDLPGMKEATPVYRTYASMQLAELSTSVTVLGIDPAAFPQVAWFRDDFSGSSLEETTGVLALHKPPPQGMALPPDTQTMGLWVSPHVPRPELSLNARLSDGNNRFFSLPLGNLGFTGWRFMETPAISEPRRDALIPSPPLYLHSIYITPRQTASGAVPPSADDPGALYLDALQVTTISSPQGVIIDDFENPSFWKAIEFPSLPRGDSLETTDALVREGRSSALLSWGSGKSYNIRGIVWEEDSAPIPALASRSLLRKTSLSLGDEPVVAVRDTSLRVRLAGATEYFPTLDPEKDSFLILPLDSLLYLSNIRTALPEVLPNEVWAEAADTNQLRQALRQMPTDSIRAFQISLRSQVLASSRADPLAAAGWSGIITLAYLAAFIVSLGGFIVYSFLIVRRRNGEVSLLRVMGLRSWQARLLVWVDQGAVLVAGLGYATWIGTRFGELITRSLDFTEKGERLLPPFVFEADWLPYLGVIVVLALAFFAIALSIAWLLLRTPLPEALRSDEG